MTTASTTTRVSSDRGRATAARRRRHRLGGHRKAGRAAAARPLHEALAVGLGCDITAYGSRKRVDRS